MVISDAFKKQSSSMGNDTVEPKIKLISDPTNIEVEVTGYDLEAQIDTKQGTLIFTTNDTPFEESLNISLVNAQGEILDALTLASAYNTGTFSDLKVNEDETVSFKFFEGKRCLFKVLPTPTRKLWSNTRIIQRSHPFFNKVYLDLKVIYE